MKYKVLVINLKERQDKLASVSKALNSLNIEFERLEAVKGTDIPKETLEQLYSVEINKDKYVKPLSLGEIGCYASHRLAWQTIIDQDLDYAIVLEDDCKILNGFESIPKIISTLINWDYIKLTGSNGKKTTDSQPLLTIPFNLVRYNKPPSATPGQVVSKQGASLLLKNSTPFFRPVDVDIQLHWEKEIDVIGIEPATITAAGYTSDIHAMDTENLRLQSSSFWNRIKFRSNAFWQNRKNKAKSTKLNDYLK